MNSYLKKDREFKYIYKRAKAKSDKNLTIFVIKGSGKIGFTITKKVGNAVIRNRIKRRLKAIHRNTDLFGNDKNYIVLAKKDAKNADYKDLENSVNRILKRFK